jgi:hypothetical protein
MLRNARVAAAIAAALADATAAGMVRNGQEWSGCHRDRGGPRQDRPAICGDRGAARIAAYIRAGYKDSLVAQRSASRLLLNVVVQAAIRAADEADKDTPAASTTAARLLTNVTVFAPPTRPTPR